MISTYVSDPLCVFHAISQSYERTIRCPLLKSSIVFSNVAWNQAILRIKSWWKFLERLSSYAGNHYNLIQNKKLSHYLWYLHFKFMICISDRTSATLVISYLWVHMWNFAPELFSWYCLTKDYFEDDGKLNSSCEESTFGTSIHLLKQRQCLTFLQHSIRGKWMNYWMNYLQKFPEAYIILHLPKVWCPLCSANPFTKLLKIFKGDLCLS